MLNEELDKKVEKQAEESKPAKATGQKLVAKKDFTIFHNSDHIVIKKGDVVKVPAKYLPNLKTEGVI